MGWLESHARSSTARCQKKKSFLLQEAREEKSCKSTDGVDVTEKVSDNAEEQKDDKSEKI